MLRLTIAFASLICICHSGRSRRRSLESNPMVGSGKGPTMRPLSGLMMAVLRSPVNAMSSSTFRYPSPRVSPRASYVWTDHGLDAMPEYIRPKFGFPKGSDVVTESQQQLLHEMNIFDALVERGAIMDEPPAGPLVRKVNTAEFEEAILDRSTPILLDLYAEWCGPCKRMAPELENVAQKLYGRVRVLKVDTEQELDVTRTLGVTAYPTLMLINDMAIVARREGGLKEDKIVQFVNYHAFGGPKPEFID